MVEQSVHVLSSVLLGLGCTSLGGCMVEAMQGWRLRDLHLVCGKFDTTSSLIGLSNLSECIHARYIKFHE